GCMIERHKAELIDSLPEVDLFLGSSEMQKLVPELNERGLLGAPSEAGHPGVRVYAGDLPHVRYMKISEGCDHGCAFCAIPLMRGKHRSFALHEVLREAQLLELQGARELNLVAQDLAHYGRDLRNGVQLLEFLEEMQFERVGAFTYSAQEGTRAADYADDVHEAVKRERLERLTELQRSITAERYAARTGCTARALVDRVDVEKATSQARLP